MNEEPKLFETNFVYEEDDLRPDDRTRYAEESFQEFLKALRAVGQTGKTPTPVHYAIKEVATMFNDGDISGKVLISNYQEIVESFDILKYARSTGHMQHRWHLGKFNEHPWLSSGLLASAPYTDEEPEMFDPLQLLNAGPETRLEMLAEWGENYLKLAREDIEEVRKHQSDILIPTSKVILKPEDGVVHFSLADRNRKGDAYIYSAKSDPIYPECMLVNYNWNSATLRCEPAFHLANRLREANEMNDMAKDDETIAKLVRNLKIDLSATAIQL